MLRTLNCTPEGTPVDLKAIRSEIEKVARDVNYIISVNGSSAFPMPNPPEQKSSLLKRALRKIAF